MEPDFNKYSLDDLYDAESNIDSKKYPDRLRKVQDLIALYESEKVENNSTILMDMEDACVRLTVYRKLDLFEVELSRTNNFVIALFKCKLVLTLDEFLYFVDCLKNGVESSHGKSNFFIANKIFIKKPTVPVQFRVVSFYSRRLIFNVAFFFATLANTLLHELYQIESKL